MAPYANVQEALEAALAAQGEQAKDITFFFQLLFNLKAARSRDVFQIHPAKASAYLIDSVYDRIHIFAFNAHRKSVDSAKLFKSIEEDKDMDYAKESLRLHGEWKGKIEVVSTVPVKTREDLLPA